MIKLILLVLLLPFTLFAFEVSATDEVTGPNVTKIITIWQALIPVAVPLIIMLLKAYIPIMPSKFVPWLAPLLGALIDVLLNFANLGTGLGTIGAALGLSGIGVRELVHNTRKTDAEPKYKIHDN